MVEQVSFFTQFTDGNWSFLSHHLNLYINRKCVCCLLCLEKIWDY